MNTLIGRMEHRVRDACTRWTAFCRRLSDAMTPSTLEVRCHDHEWVLTQTLGDRLRSITLPATPDEQALPRLRMELRAAGLRGGTAVLTLPTFLHHLRLEPLVDDARSAAIRRAMAPLLPFPADQAVIRHKHIVRHTDSDQAQDEVLVLAVDGTRLEAALAYSRALGLTPTAVDADVCAFVRSVQPSQAPATCRLFIGLERQGVLAVVVNGDDIVFAKRINAPYAEELVACIQYHDALFPDDPVQTAHILRRHVPDADGIDDGDDTRMADLVLDWPQHALIPLHVLPTSLEVSS